MGAQLSALWWPGGMSVGGWGGEGDSMGKGCVYTLVVSDCCTAKTKTTLQSNNTPILKSTFLFCPTSLVVYCPIWLFSSGAKMLSFHSELLPLLSFSLKRMPSDFCSHCSIETALTCVPISHFRLTRPISRSLLVQQITSSSLTSSPLPG